MIPPTKYIHPPAVPVIETVMSKEEVDRFCRNNGAVVPPGYRAEGCLLFSSYGECLIYRIDSIDVRKHEIAHCNGWPQSHPGGRWRAPEPLPVIEGQKNRPEKPRIVR